MRFQLAKTLNGIKKYGPIFDLGTGDNSQVEEYVVEDIDNWFLDNIIDQINAECDTLLDDGDFDYIGAEKCRKLIALLDNLPKSDIPKDFYKTIDVLKNYAKRAVEYNTGIEIEM